jgi:hypothetical protein
MRTATALGKYAGRDAPMTIKFAPQQDPVLGLWWSKSSEQHGQDKHPRGPSTPRN